MRNAVRNAFTLVELLVVIAIIGVLVALLLPAVQTAREAARRSQCLNNFKQMALAVQNYQDTQKVLPPANITPSPCCSTPGYSNWCIAILPFMEQSALYEKYNHNASNQDPSNAFVRTYHMPGYSCPTDPHSQPGTRFIPDSGPGNTQKLEYATGSYRAMGGRYDGLISKWDTGQDPGKMKPEWRGPMHMIGYAGLKCETMASITDGTSNTTLIGEYTTKTHASRTTFWAYSYGCYASSCAFIETRTFLNDFDKCVAIGGAGAEDPCKRSFASFHSGGQQVALCDGSTRFISKTIDMLIWVNMGSIGGGEVGTAP